MDEYDCHEYDCLDALLKRRHSCPGFLPRPVQRPQERSDWDDRDDSHRKKRRSSIFDIFD